MPHQHNYENIKSNQQVTVIFISGFMMPTNYISYPIDLIPPNVKVIEVFPSPVGSSHDRVCEVFYELIGGYVDYGEEHSRFHDHDRYSKKSLPGKYPIWNENNPIYVIGYSVGSLTAWVLQNYLQSQKFSGYNTSSKWISGIITVNPPFNGAMAVYNKGLNNTLPPMVHWGSSGFIISCIASILEYLDSSLVKFILFFEFGLGHRNLSWDQQYSFWKLLKTFVGVSIHSNTDNLPYDVSIQSQLVWHQYLQIFPDTFYCNVVGRIKSSYVDKTNQQLYSNNIEDNNINLTNKHYLLSFSYLLECLITDPTHSIPDDLLCANVLHPKKWFQHGHDRFLSVYTQEYPRLNPNSPKGEYYQDFMDEKLHNNMKKGVWNYTYRDITHINVAIKCRDTWSYIFQTLTLIADKNNNNNNNNNNKNNNYDNNNDNKIILKSVPSSYYSPLPDQQIQ
eukprot:gene11997-16061_t